MFRFTIRDVLWLTAVVALGVGWWVDHRQSQRWEDLAITAADGRERWQEPFSPPIARLLAPGKSSAPRATSAGKREQVEFPALIGLKPSGHSKQKHPRSPEGTKSAMG
jgi:hypothetical protein